MPRYLISFDDGAMTFPEEELAAVADAAHAVVREAMDAGVWVFGGGLVPLEQASVVGADGTVAERPYARGSKAHVSGLCVIDVSTHGEALEWAVKIAAACRCAQDVREFMPDPAVGN